MQEEEQFWPDGTPRSTNNVFTRHGFKIGAPTAPSPQRASGKKGGFGAKGGTIPGMGMPHAPDFNTVIKRRA